MGYADYYAKIELYFLNNKKKEIFVSVLFIQKSSTNLKEMEKFLKQQEKKQKKEVKREEKKQEKLFSKAKKDQRSFLRDSFPPIGRKNEFTLHQLKNFNESNELKIPYFCEDNTFQNIFLGLKEEPDQQGIVTTDVLRRKMYDSFLDEPPSGPGRCDCEQCRRIELTDGNMNEMHCHYLDEEDGMTVMSQPPLHIVKGDKIVPIMPIAVLSGIIVVINLAIMMIFIDLLARQAVGSQTYFGIWGPACIVILAGGAMSICKLITPIVDLLILYFYIKQTCLLKAPLFLL